MAPQHLPFRGTGAFGHIWIGEVSRQSLSIASSDGAQRSGASGKGHRLGVVMRNIIAFPQIKPPFLEVGPEAVDGYTHVIRYRDERYRSMVFRRCMSKREALAVARDYGCYPIVGFAAEHR